MTQAVNLAALANNGSLQLPYWTTATRPTGVAGLTGFNTTTGFAEYWTGSQWATYGSVATTSVSYLIVAGGGSGNDGYINADFIAGGGGGAGGMLTGTQAVTPGTSYTVTVGAGGAYTFVEDTAASGSNSLFSAVGTTAIGGGGGGKQSRGGGNGGSGIVILSIPTAKYTGTTTGSPTVTTSGANTILKFTASGTYTA